MPSHVFLLLYSPFRLIGYIQFDQNPFSANIFSIVNRFGCFFFPCLCTLWLNRQINQLLDAYLKNFTQILQQRMKPYILRSPLFDLDELEEKVKEIVSKRISEINTLKSQDAFRKEFLGNVAHELKTPLFTVQGYISTLLDGAIVR